MSDGGANKEALDAINISCGEDIVVGACTGDIGQPAADPDVSCSAINAASTAIKRHTSSGNSPVEMCIVKKQESSTSNSVDENIVKEQESAASATVHLGFVVRPRFGHRLLSEYFPSKVGGRPAWLQLSRLPASDSLLCGLCRRPMVFLCQLYCPLEDRADCFHRTLFVFVCRGSSDDGSGSLCPPASDQDTDATSSNCGRNVVAFRSQLPRVNLFYSDCPPSDDEDEDDSDSSQQNVNENVDAEKENGNMFERRQNQTANGDFFSSLCAVCGCQGRQYCSGCRKVAYCGRLHQTMDWSAGHKQRCKDGKPGDASRSFLLPEAEVVIEDEPDDSAAKNRDNCGQSDSTDERRMADYLRLIRNNGQSMPDADASDLQSAATGVTDQQYWRFRRRVAREPQQTVRYCRGGRPLWVSDRGQPPVRSDNAEATPPACQRCGATRRFEFQVMPQMLNHVRSDSLDWGTLAVYTCSASCAAESLSPPPEPSLCSIDPGHGTNKESAYIEEFVWRQPM